MTARTGLETAGRLVVAAVCVVTSLYGLFAYVPFTYTQVIQSRLVEGLWLFAVWHRPIVWVASGVVVWALRDQWASRQAGGIMLSGASLAFAAGLTFHPVLAAVQNNASAIVIALGALLPAAWLAALDLREHWRKIVWTREAADDDARVFKAAGGAAVFVSAVYAAAWWLRLPPAGVTGQAAAVSLLWGVSAHAVVFAALFAALMLLRGLSGGGPRAEFVLVGIAAALGIATVLRQLVFASIAFGGPAATLMAGALALTLTAAPASIIVLQRGASKRPVASGVALWLNPRGADRSVLRSLVGLAVLTAVGITAVRAAAPMDWNYLLQKLSAILVWGAAFAMTFALARSSRRLHWPVLLGVAAAAPIAFAALERTADRSVADAYANYEPSFRTIRDAVVPSGAAATDSGFYKYLEANTNIPRNQRVEPVDVNLVDRLESTPGPKPNIFVIVIDSLRRDYLSPFNPVVTFTPSVAALAAESDVFTNAYTRYGATGLSEPSIWVGGMLVHKQYVTPFAPMNALDKLLTVERYRQFVSIDSILRTLLPPSPLRAELDEQIPTKDYDLCRSLTELEGKLDASRADAAPVFAYTQPQNVHVSRIAREGHTVPPGEHYPGFDDPYAARVHRLDGCIGQFIGYLKMAGLYDRSVVVLTSDHGDSLGEDGRFGHAYTIFPEVMRIPLIVHVPPALRSRLNADSNGVVFSTDITPTLYALLGHEPTLAELPFGRPLFVAKDAPPRAPRGDAVVASSYGTVYGLLENGGRGLYIVDAINFQDYEYDLSRGLVGERTPVTPEQRVAGQRAIREQVAAIARFYRFDPGSP